MTVTATGDTGMGEARVKFGFPSGNTFGSPTNTTAEFSLFKSSRGSESGTPVTGNERMSYRIEPAPLPPTRSDFQWVVPYDTQVLTAGSNAYAMSYDPNSTARVTATATIKTVSVTCAAVP